MNDELKSALVKVALMSITGIATALHANPQLAGLYPALAADLVDLGVLGYGLYLNRGMKKVPVDAHATVAGVTVSAPGETTAAINPPVVTK